MYYGPWLHGDPLKNDRQTDTCDNITFQQLRWWTVKHSRLLTSKGRTQIKRFILSTKKERGLHLEVPWIRLHYRLTMKDRALPTIPIGMKTGK